MVATSTVPALRFVRVRHAGTERRFVLLDGPTRERYVELVARSAGAIEGLLSPSVMANRVASWSVRPPERDSEGVSMGSPREGVEERDLHRRETRGCHE